VEGMAPQERVFEDLMAVVPPLLQALDRLAFAARYLHPPTFLELMAAVGAPDDPLRAVRPRLDDWPGEMGGLTSALTTAIDETLSGWDELRAAPQQEDGLGAIFRAFRRLPRALEALYPL